MKRFLLDTNLLLLFLREDERWEILNNKFGLDGLFNYTSIVCLGELESLAVRNKWGYKRVERLNVFGQISSQLMSMLKQLSNNTVK
jgi:hypothetical protein